MKIHIHALKKWTGITLFCGAHSFFWGYQVDGEIASMIAGLVTLILIFSFVDSHPRYQAKRAANALFARAMDIGVKIRLYFAGYIMAIGALDYFSKGDTPLAFRFPQVGELWIGMGATYLSGCVTGSRLGLYRKSPDNQYETLAHHYFTTYLSTIFTGLMHTAILAILCGLVYLVLRMKKKA